MRSSRLRVDERHDTRDRVPDGGPTGFTLAETVLALGITATLVATLVPVCVRVAGATLAAHDQSMSTMLAVARLEQLRGLTFTFDETGGAGAIRVTDTVTDVAAPGEVRGSCTQQVRSTNNYCEISLNDTNIHYFQDKS